MMANLSNLRRDPIAFIQGVLIDPETGKPFELYPAQIEFLREGLTPTADGRLPYPEIVYAAIKKSGKTATAAMAMLYVIVALGGSYAEGYCAANDFDQAQGRVFQAICRIIEASPMLRDSAKITANKIEFPSTGATITAIASDYAGAAGANPTFTVFDELWAYTSERAYRLWDEMVPPPTRKIAARLTVTYAGFEGESKLLETLYKRAMEGEEIVPSLYRAPGLLAAWHHKPVAPWQTPEWIEQMRQQLRPNAFLRQIENRFVTNESSFVDMAWYDACVDPELSPELTNPGLSVWVGVDASVKRDSTAIVAATFAGGKVRLVWHRIFQPSPTDPLDFEQAVEKTLLELRRRFYVREVRFDPYQLVSVAQRLTIAGLPMVEFAQSVPNLTEASTNLYEIVKGRNLVAYSDPDVRLAMSRAVALETTRGWRIAKEKQSHKIDVVVALAQAALGAVQQGQISTKFEYTPGPRVDRSAVWDGVSSGNRLYARGKDIADAEDRAAVMEKVRWGRRGWGNW
jgi:phage terminase large subunit-like protein